MSNGMIYPTQKGMLSGNPRDSAIAQMNQTNSKQASLIASVGGKKTKRKPKTKRSQTKSKRKSKHNRNRRYGGSTIAVPQYQMLYSPQGGPGTDPNAQIQSNSRVATQGTANAVYDNYATQKGGYFHKKRKYKKSTRWVRSSRGGSGLTPNQEWGCLS